MKPAIKKNPGLFVITLPLSQNWYPLMAEKTEIWDPHIARETFQVHLFPAAGT
jgi:hypothetical protein